MAGRRTSAVKEHHKQAREADCELLPHRHSEKVSVPPAECLKRNVRENQKKDNMLLFSIYRMTQTSQIV